MNAIQMVDLQNQYLHIRADIDEAIQQVIGSAFFIKGPPVAEFEKNLANHIGVKHAIGCGNGTDALQIALMALDLPLGSEIITPSFGYAALAEVILLMGMVPVFVEVNPDTFLMETSWIESAITEKTKVIAAVHLYGQVCNMEAILDIAERHELWVLEDAAQAIGAKYTFDSGVVALAGTIGHVGTTSFFPSKNLGCFGDGGAVFTNSDILAEKISMIANHGQKAKYEHDVIGINSRLDTIQAAILNVKLKHLNNYEASRNFCADYYDKNLAEIKSLKTPQRADKSSHVFHQYTITLENSKLRNELKTYLQDCKIPTMIYYPKPLHCQKAYSQNISLPITENLCNQVLSLPIHTEMEQVQLEYIVNQIKTFFK